jgi:hypothetical protein
MRCPEELKDDATELEQRLWSVKVAEVTTRQ